MVMYKKGVNKITFFEEEKTMNGNPKYKKLLIVTSILLSNILLYEKEQPN